MGGGERGELLSYVAGWMKERATDRPKNEPDDVAALCGQRERARTSSRITRAAGLLHGLGRIVKDTVRNNVKN